MAAGSTSPKIMARSVAVASILRKNWMTSGWVNSMSAARFVPIRVICCDGRAIARRVSAMKVAGAGRFGIGDMGSLGNSHATSIR